MSAIDRVKGHYASLCGAGRKYIDVPEWGDGSAPLRIFWTPLTGLDLRQAKIGGANNEADFAELVAAKAEGEDGKKLFDPIKDAHVLRTEADTLVVTRIGLTMVGSIPTTGDQAKN